MTTANLNTRKRQATTTARGAVNHVRQRAMQAEESFLGNVGEGLESAYDTAIEGLETVGTTVRGAFKPKNIVPVAIGSFVVGVAAGIFGTIFYPKVRDSAFVGTLGTKLASAKDSMGESFNSAKNSLGETFNSAKDSVMKSVKEATSDIKNEIGTKTAGNNGTINPSRLA